MACKMKFFVVLLVLLLAHLARPSEPALLGKLLYEDGHFIAENYDARSLDYAYSEDRFIFESAQRSSFGEMHLNGDLRKQNLAFAIDYFPRGPGFNWKDLICERNSDERLRHLIEHCHGNTTMRSLTDEERMQIQDYKNEQKESKKPFEVIWRDDRRLIKSVNTSEVSLIRGVLKNEAFTFSVLVNPGEKRNRFQIFGDLANRTFIVEGLPATSREECGKTGLEELKTKCEGKIRLRPIETMAITG